VSEEQIPLQAVVSCVSALIEQHPQLSRVLAYLGATQQCSSPYLRQRMEHLARIERQMAGQDRGEISRVCRERMGVSKSRYYQIRAQAIEAGLVSDAKNR
jgi:hypothetical protein